MRTLIHAAAAATLLIFASAPAYAQNVNRNAEGTFGRVSLDADFTPDPYYVSVAAGGPVDASNLSDECVGRIAQRASFTLNYRAGTQYPLHISAASDADAVLVVLGPDGRWRCDDDSAGGLNPGVTYESPRSGRYQIWVGVYGGEQIIPATIYVSEIEQVGRAGATPDFTMAPAYGAVALVAGFTPDPHTVELLAGGELDARELGVPGCVGAIARAPDYRVNWSGNSGLPLFFSASSEFDTTLVINDPHGNWVCDDDGGGQLNPLIRFDSPAEGQYDIWVGTYAPGDLRPAVLAVSELGGQ